MKTDRLRVDIALKKNLLFTLIVAIFLLQAYFHDKNIVYIFVFFLIAIVIVNNFILKRNLKNLDFDLINIQNRFVNDKSLIWLKVKNSSSIDRYNIYVDKKISFDVLANSEKDIYLIKKFAKRGVVTDIEIEISSTFPLNMFDRYYSILNFKKRIIVYPEKKGKSLKESFGYGLARFGERENFRGIKEYQVEDKASLIHWKSLAKGELKTKEFDYQLPYDRYIFDLEKMDGSLEDRLSQITVWVVEADKYNLKFIVKLKDSLLSSEKLTLKEILTRLALYNENL